MKLVSYEFGQALQLIRMEEMRPDSGVYVPDIFEKIKARYRFVSAPKEIGANLASAGATFETGVIRIDNREIAITSLGIYPDGILTLCRRTEDADLVTDNFIQWAISECGLRHPQTQIPRRYGSQVIVDLDESVDRLLHQFDAITKTLEAALEKEVGLKVDLHVTRIGLAADPLEGIPPNQTTFTIEPRAGAPFSEHRYYCAAPLPSPAHLETLTTIEKVLTRTQSGHRS